MHRFLVPAFRRYFYHTTAMPYSVNIANQQVRVTGCSSDEEFNQVLSFQPFKDWLAAFDQQQKTRQNELNVESIQIQNIDYFGSNKIGFCKFKTQATFKDSGKSVPGIVFMVNMVERKLLYSSLIQYIERWCSFHVDHIKIQRSKGQDLVDTSTTYPGTSFELS
jgi:hypothetical protein